MTNHTKKIDFRPPRDLGERTPEGLDPQQDIEWREKCRALVPAAGDVYPPNFSNGVPTYEGSFLIRTSDQTAYYVEVKDFGWEPVEGGELDEEGNIVKEAIGENCIHVIAVDLESGEQTKADFAYLEDTVGGIAYALSRAVEEGEDMKEPGRYGEFVLEELLSMVGK